MIIGYECLCGDKLRYNVKERKYVHLFPNRMYDHKPDVAVVIRDGVREGVNGRKHLRVVS